MPKIRPGRISVFATWQKLKFVPVGLLAAIFALKFGVLVQLADHPLLQPGGGLDSDYYSQLAQRVAAGDLLLGPGLYFVSPLYIYFLAALLAAGGSLFAIKVVQIALGTIACALVWLTTRAWFGERAAGIALVLAGLTGVFTFYEVLSLQAALDPFLTALDLWLLTRALKEHVAGRAWPWRSLAAGLALAVHVLNRPNMLIVAAGLTLVLIATRPRPAALWKAAAFAIGLAIGLVPLAMRNQVVAGTWAPVPSHGGLNLYIGNNPNADGTYRSVEGITPNIQGQAADARRVAERAEGRTLTDTEVSAHFTRRAIGWMRQHPYDAARLFLLKVAYTLNRTFLTLNYSYPFYRDESALLRVLFVGPLVLVPLGIVGLFTFAIRGAARPPGFAPFAATVPLLVVSVAVFFVASRYRVPLLVALCVPAGALLDATVVAIRCRRAAAVTLATVAVAAAAVLTAWDFGLNDLRAEEETQMALTMIDRHRWEEAGRYIARAAAHHHDPGRFHLRIGEAYASADRPAEALVHLEAAHRDGARTVASSYQLAAAYLQQGRLVEAARALDAIDLRRLSDRASKARLADVYHALGLKFASAGHLAPATDAFQRAVTLAPESATAHLNLAVAYAESGRRDEAREEARRALALNPSYQRARDLLAALGPR